MKSLTALLLLSFVFLSCSTEPSLQRYMVDRESSPNFISASLSTNLLLQNLDELTSEETISFEKINKVNVLAYMKSDSLSELENERNTLKSILVHSDFESLFEFNNGEREAHLMFVGAQDHIRELVFYGYDFSKGMLLLRLDAKDLKADDLYRITQSTQKLYMTDLSNNFSDFLGKLN